jgi:hypothetical protein
MRRPAVVDVLSIILVVGLVGDLAYLHHRMSVTGKLSSTGDLLDGARLLPMPAVGLTGERITIETGRPKLLLYTLPSCGGCRREMPEWVTAARQIGRENVLFVLAGATPDQARNVPEYLSSNQLPGFPAVRVDSSIMKEYHMLAIPRTILVDSNGVVKQVWRGAVVAKTIIQAWKSTQ